MAFRALQAFGNWQIGDLIEKADLIGADERAFVVRVADDIEPVAPLAETLSAEETKPEGA